MKRIFTITRPLLGIFLATAYLLLSSAAVLHPFWHSDHHASAGAHSQKATAENTGSLCFFCVHTILSTPVESISQPDNLPVAQSRFLPGLPLRLVLRPPTATTLRGPPAIG